MGKSPIFIVGAPRSGTTLLAAMLNGHSSLACGPETQFFNKTDEVKLLEAVKDPRWPQLALKIITSLTLGGQYVHNLYNISKSDLASFLSSRKPSIKTMLESITAIYSTRMGKQRWVEKTPDHVLKTELIRQEFPDSSIILIIRDPRDSALSMRQFPWLSHSVVANCFIWEKYLKNKKFFEIDSNTYTVYYEKLVLSPKNELQKLCNFLGEEFEEQMLDTRKSGKNVITSFEQHKTQVLKPLDYSRLYVWKRELPDFLKNASTFFCLSGITYYKYECIKKPIKTIQTYYLDKNIIEANENLFAELANKGIRFKSASSLLIPKELFVIPNIPFWGKGSLKWCINLISILIIRLILLKKNYYYPNFKTVTRKLNKILYASCCFLCKKFDI